MRNDIDTNFFKGKLEEELLVVEGELKKLGSKHPLNGVTDWEATAPKNFEIDEADETETADKIEEFEENTAVLKELEIRYNDIKAALDKIEGGTYGTCEVSHEPIEKDRLEANPAARTCKAHMNTV